ncbi:hypothetical protein ACFQ1S_01540 [Kibdelosporangium lantanae]|uniref:Uncharacterized protein n=1 Tax=Kibdelosporangium lantanae TaxID=1497396 RepID=A0ABW3M329_9PSEU
MLNDHGDPRILEVCRSVVVREDGRLYQPVRSILSERCFEIIDSYQRKDRDMLRGEAEWMTAQLYTSCPPVKHQCNQLLVPRPRVAPDLRRPWLCESVR